jgi:aromatic-L-amino-acid decarboxylase
MADSMSPEEFRRYAHEVVDWMADYLADIRRYPVLPRVEPGSLVDSLPASGPEQGESMDTILNGFFRYILPGITHWNHPRFFGYFSVSASGPGILGEMIASALNINGMLWRTSPAVTELEQVTLGWIRDWIGLPQTTFGIIHDTASIGVLHAILAARERHAPSVRRDGTHPPMTLYASEHAHSSIAKSALAAGIGQENVRLIPSDAEFRMDTAALERAIESDQAAGKHPFFVAATLGTTSATSVDPLPHIAEIARRHGLWLHADGAYAGVAALLDEFRHQFSGIEEADSVIVNPHKWLFTPIDLSILYLQDAGLMKRAVAIETPAYLKAAEHPRALNYSEYGLALGRRFRALKLWFVLRYYGRKGIARILRNHIAWAQELAAAIEAHPDFELAAPVPFSLVCFRWKGSDEDNRRLVDQVNETGHAFLTGTQLGGRFVIRLAVGNVAATREDVFSTWNLIQQYADRLPQKPVETESGPTGRSDT